MVPRKHCPNMSRRGRLLARPSPPSLRAEVTASRSLPKVPWSPGVTEPTARTVAIRVGMSCGRCLLAAAVLCKEKPLSPWPPGRTTASRCSRTAPWRHGGATKTASWAIIRPPTRWSLSKSITPAAAACSPKERCARCSPPAAQASTLWLCWATNPSPSTAMPGPPISPSARKRRMLIPTSRRSLRRMMHSR